MNTTPLSFRDLMLIGLVYQWCKVGRNDCISHHKLLTLMNATIDAEQIPIRLADKQKSTHIIQSFADRMAKLGWIDGSRTPITPTQRLVDVAEDLADRYGPYTKRLPETVQAVKSGIVWG